MDKFSRNYELSIQTISGLTVVIKPPFTLEFDVKRDIYSSAHNASLRIINLSKNTRSQIQKAEWDYDSNRALTLRAGYGENMPVIFKGNVSACRSAREGVNFVTQVECFDGGFAFANAQTETNFPQGAALNTVLDALIESLPGVKKGAIGAYQGVLQRANAVSGNTTDRISELSGQGFFIDNGTAHCLGTNECLKGEVQIIDSKSGLLGTPVRENGILHFDVLFEPRILIGQKIELKSTTGDNVNGFYKIFSIHHKGVISESICGNAVTTLGMFYGAKELVEVGNV